MTFKSLFGPFTILSLSFVTFLVSRFYVSYLTHETFKLGLQNTLNMSKTARVYFGVLQSELVLLLSLPFSLMVVFSLRVVACYSNYFSIHTLDYSFILGSRNYCPHMGPVVVAGYI